MRRHFGTESPFAAWNWRQSRAESPFMRCQRPGIVDSLERKWRQSRRPRPGIVGSLAQNRRLCVASGLELSTVSSGPAVRGLELATVPRGIAVYALPAAWNCRQSRAESPFAARNWRQSRAESPFWQPEGSEERRGATGYGEGLRVLFMRDEPREFEWARTRACLLRPKSSAFVGASSVYGAAR